MYTTVICQIFTFTRAYTVLLETLHVCMSGPRPLQRTHKTSRIFFKVCPSVSKKNHKFRVLAFIHHSIDAVIKAPRTNCLPAAVEVYIFSFMCSAEREREMQNVTMLLCTMAGIVERIRKRKEKREKRKIAHDVAFAGPSLACMQMLSHFFGESAVSPRVQ